MLTIIHRRYIILQKLGHGGMGVTYKVRDRLTNEVVTLKQGVSPSLEWSEEKPTTREQPTSRRAAGGRRRWLGEDTTKGVGSSHRRMALAREFSVLASLRHPNVIQVLDYGFDDVYRPYMIMELVDEARDLVTAASGRPLAERVGLLLQTLEALTCLHRHQIVHRDIKPSNVLVSPSGRVKVLDFGISHRLSEEELRSRQVVGTAGYIAPEVLGGEAPGVRSDLFAFGVLACWALFECPPAELPHGDARLGHARALGCSEEVVGRLVAVVQELTATRPEQRPESAWRAGEWLCDAAGLERPAESPAARDGLIQAARFVGRDRQLNYLRDLLTELLKEGGGAAQLIGGESGVGKSRLMMEFRSHALVHGVLVFQGQSLSGGSRPYALWRPVARMLVVVNEPTVMELQVLKELIPDIELLAGHPEPLPPAPEVEAEAAHARLVEVLLSMLKRLGRPPVFLLEDLQWARPESLRVMHSVWQHLDEIGGLLLATFRDNEVPTGWEPAEAMPTMTLRRLRDADIAALAASMLGVVGEDQRVIEALSQGAEGNPFFVVELVRALAEGAGGLSRLGVMDIVEGVPDGIATLLRRRLTRLPKADQRWLRLAAVAGRELDIALLSELHVPDERSDATAWEARLDRWEAAAVVDRDKQGHWRFAHDMFRECLLADLDEAQQAPQAHQQVAEALERARGDSPGCVEPLAYHWRRAGDARREAHYTTLAGEQALHIGATREALRLLRRALELLPPASPPSPRDTPRRLLPADLSGLFVDDAAPRGLPRSLRRPLFTPADQPPSFHEARGEPRLVHRARLEGLIAEAHHQSGNHAQSIEHARRALALLGEPIPEQPPRLWASLVGQLLERRAQSWLPTLYRIPEPDRVRALTIAIQVRVMESFFYVEEQLPLVWSACRALNLGEPAGPSPMLARCYILTGLLLGLRPSLRGLAGWCVERARETAAELDDPATTVFVAVREAIFNIYEARWSESERLLSEALALANELRDARQSLEAGCIRGLVVHYQGRFEESEALNREVAERFKDPLDVQARLWPPLEQGYNLLRCGAIEDAAAFHPRIMQVVTEEVALTDQLLVRGFEALLWLRQGQNARARAAADAINALMRDQSPVAYWIEQPLSIACEVLLHVWRDAPESAPERLKASAEVACVTMEGFSARFPFAKPAACLWRGVLHQLKGNGAQARRSLERAVELGNRCGTPYASGRAHLELARLSPPGGAARAAHRERAVALLSPLGCLHGEPEALTVY